MSKNIKQLNIFNGRFKFSWWKIIYLIVLLLCFFSDLGLLLWLDINFSIKLDEKILFNFFLIAFLFGNVWINLKLSPYLYAKWPDMWEKITFNLIKKLNFFGDIFLVLLLVAWNSFLGTWFYDLSYWIANISSFTTNITPNFVSFFSSVCTINFCVLSFLVWLYLKPFKKGNDIKVDPSELTYSFIFYRIFQFYHFCKRKCLKNNKEYKKWKQRFDHKKSLPIIKENIILFPKNENPYSKFQMRYETYQKIIRNSQPKSKDILIWYSMLIITSFWALLITVLCLILVLYFLWINSSHVDINSQIRYCCYSFVLMAGSFFINTFFIHYITNNFRFFAHQNELKVYGNIERIKISVNKENRLNIPLFYFFALLKEILLISTPYNKWTNNKLIFNFNIDNLKNVGNNKLWNWAKWMETSNLELIFLENNEIKINIVSRK